MPLTLSLASQPLAGLRDYKVRARMSTWSRGFAYRMHCSKGSYHANSIIILGAAAWKGCGRVTGNKESIKHGLMMNDVSVYYDYPVTVYYNITGGKNRGGGGGGGGSASIPLSTQNKLSGQCICSSKHILRPGRLSMILYN